MQLYHPSTGKHFNVTSGHEVQTGIDIARYFAGWADKNHGQTLEVSILYDQ